MPRCVPAVERAWTVNYLLRFYPWLPHARYKARVHARRAYRKENPPTIACPKCTATFGLYRPFRRHYLFKCPKNGNGEHHPTIRRA